MISFIINIFKKPNPFNIVCGETLYYVKISPYPSSESVYRASSEGRPLAEVVKVYIYKDNEVGKEYSYKKKCTSGFIIDQLYKYGNKSWYRSKLIAIVQAWILDFNVKKNWDNQHN